MGHAVRERIFAVPYRYEVLWNVLTYRFLKPFFKTIEVSEFHNYKKALLTQESLNERCLSSIKPDSILLYHNIADCFSEKLNEKASLVTGYLRGTLKHPSHPCCFDERKSLVAKEESIVNRADLVFLTSHYPLQYYSGDKIVYAGLPVDFNFFSRLRQEKRKFTIAWNTRLHKDKGAPEFLDFAEAILSMDSSVRMMVFVNMFHTQFMKRLNTLNKKFGENLHVFIDPPADSYLRMLSSCSLTLSFNVIASLSSASVYSIAAGTPVFFRSPKDTIEPDYAYASSTEELISKVLSMKENPRKLAEIYELERNSIEHLRTERVVERIVESVEKCL